MKNLGHHIQHCEEVLFFALHPDQEKSHSHLSSLSLYKGGHELFEEDDIHHMLILSSN